VSVESEKVVTCRNCGLELEDGSGTPVEDGSGCPGCGFTSRHIALSLSETITFHEMLGLKGRHATGGRPFIEQKVGDDFHRKSGRWMRLERSIDREKNWYKEIITDPETGKIVHECEEPLSAHRDHGDKKSRRYQRN
jgi:hypothetical protein